MVYENSIILSHFHDVNVELGWFLFLLNNNTWLLTMYKWWALSFQTTLANNWKSLFLIISCHSYAMMERVLKVHEKCCFRTPYVIYDYYFLLNWTRFSRGWEMNCWVTLRPLLQSQENWELLVTAKCHFLPSEKMHENWFWQSKYFEMPLDSPKSCTSIIKLKYKIHKLDVTVKRQ